MVGKFRTRTIARFSYRLFFACFFFGSVIGCEQSPLLYDVSQKDALEILSVLHHAGIKAESTRGKGSGAARFTIAVHAEQFGNAVNVLHAARLPRESSLTLQELLGGGGFLPPSLEVEKRRLDHAVSLELQELIEEIPAVESCQVIVRGGEDASSGSQAVSVVIRKAKNSDISIHQISTVVATAVPGLTKEKIAVSIFEDEGHFTDSIVSTPLVTLFGIVRIAEEDYPTFALVLLLGTLAITLSGAILGFWFRAVTLRMPPSDEAEQLQLPSERREELL